ncbi:MAG: ECF-type riboflavin transporter substrate-binding protein [Streptococcaceae bacterium]|jgi:energy-coupling factor transport system substrate-specific component|nr:ECF-type riboflavin transporter substrate-binding protein [Streptococcaceae bacterium]
MFKVTTRTFVAAGIGAAIFFVLDRFVALPVFANTTFGLQYGILGLFAVIFGPITGFLVAFIGHTLNDLTYGAPWWSWIFADGILGLLVGLLVNRIKIASEPFTGRKIVLFNIWQIVANIICWGVIAPLGDILIYKEPANKVFTQGLVASIGDIISMGVIGTILLVAYSHTIVKPGSLKKED